jgi:type IV secretory pathway TraG/TraD family ATPase VirD4
VQTPAWQNGFCNQCLKAAHAKQKSPIEAHDFEIAMTYFAGEFPTMADRTRSSITVGVMGILFVFNTGICRDLISRETTISPDVTLQGKWILVDMPVSEHGDNGALIGAGFKYLTQRMVLLRQPAETDYIIVIWVDEAATAVTTYDAIYLSQSRSHLGASIYLMQSLDGLYSAMQGESGKHEINSLLTNFATGKLFFALGDEISANYAAGLCGKRRETFVGTSLQPADNLWDELYGQGRFSTSTSEHYEFAVKPHEFMNGLRTGGAANKLICDSVLVRSGVPFANGSNHLFISWSQE